jgi:2-haloacid dehalogenase
MQPSADRVGSRPTPRALAFDVFGTVVDWRSTVVEEGEALGARTGVQADWAAVADAWRSRYRPAMARVTRGELPWLDFDELHRLTLDELIEELGIAGLSDEDRARFTTVWHRLRPWPDARPGLARLAERFTLATLSNGTEAMLREVAERGGLPFHHFFSAEHAHAYKPDPSVYRLTCEQLRLDPEEVTMVASHGHDLDAARGVGMRTAFVARPLEWGPGGGIDREPGASFDVEAMDFEDLAGRFGA